MHIYAITLEPDKDEPSFERFMREEIFPAIPKNARRDGQVTGLVLLKGHNTGHTNEYLWIVYGTVNGGAAGQKVRAIEAFGARVAVARDSHCGSWFADGADPDREEALPLDEEL